MPEIDRISLPEVIEVNKDNCVNCHACISACPVKYCNDGSADFVKVNPPDAKNILQSAQFLKQATLAAGKTKIICSGGAKEDENKFLEISPGVFSS